MLVNHRGDLKGAGRSYTRWPVAHAIWRLRCGLLQARTINLAGFISPLFQKTPVLYRETR
jgi:hypothetical protein